MILRALFWIAVVVILMPREPDLGFGRPGMTTRWNDGARTITRCSEKSACADALGVLDRLQAIAVRNLAEVKADIEREDRRHSRAD